MIAKFLLVGTILLIIDITFITLVLGPIFSRLVNRIQNSPMKFNILGAMVSYLAITIGIYKFGLERVNKDNILLSSLLGGGLFGLLSYAIFDFTNLAIFSEYSISAAVIDTVWGGTVCFLVTLISYYVANYFNL